MIKLLLTFTLALFALTGFGQADLNNYLKTHHYSFSLDKGFDTVATDSLKRKFSNYNLVILGEGGSHYLQFYNPLRLVFVKFLNKQFGMRHFFLESGHSSDILWNKFLKTGDTSYIPIYGLSTKFWLHLYNYNESLHKSETVTPLGIDFERTNSYCKSLKVLLPNSVPPENIRNSIDLIRNANDTLRDCDYILNINSQLKQNLKENRDPFKTYFSNNFDDFDLIINNNGNCKDAFKNRNKHMAENLLRFASILNERIYYLQIGMAHSVLLYKNTASYINNSGKFKNKVCVINTYCYNCSTVKEQVTNWQLHKIENDILENLLPYCKTDFTLFDFSENSQITKKFRMFGQFLLIAKNQN